MSAPTNDNEPPLEGQGDSETCHIIPLPKHRRRSPVAQAQRWRGHTVPNTEKIVRVVALAKGKHTFDIYRYSSGRFECFLGLYDGDVTVIAGKKYMALRRLFQKHSVGLPPPANR